jgi:hypothetical protein
MTNALFPSFKCNAAELEILAARIARYHNARPVETITGQFDSTPWFYNMGIMNGDATDENAALAIETGTMISLCDIVGQDFWESLDDQKRVAVGPCLLKMIGQNLLKASFAIVETN